MNNPRQPRSPHMKLAGYYLARCGARQQNKPANPPTALEVNSWKEAYDIFYDAMGDGRSPSKFRNSLATFRNACDILFENGRRGWKGANQLVPRPLAPVKTIHKEWESRPDKELENYIFTLLSESRTDSFDAEPDEEYETRTEGGQRVVVSTKSERDPELRKQAIRIHGYSCMSCSFNFEEFYGEIGKGFIEVHHIVPLSKAGKRETNPETDLIVLCANCHRMVHRQKRICLSLTELKNHIQDQGGRFSPSPKLNDD